jgi:transglutaminase-like putative cysteine protease
MKLQITHQTRYDYLPAVETAQHMAYLQPLSTAHQRLLSHFLTVSPTPTQMTQAVDVFGNPHSFFSLQTPHTVLEVLARSVVSTVNRTLPASNISWEQTRELLRYRSDGHFHSAAEFVFASPFVPREAEFASYARASFTPGSNVLTVAMDLMQRIHQDFIYESQSTKINTPAREALAQRKGVCQDFAHIMLACLRSMGLAARYVSGYLLTEPAPGTVKLTGSDASHAWVAVYAPDLPPGERWCDFDPTNDRCGWHSPGADYVTLAVGRDFSDVSPMRGVIHGGASHTLSVGVTVEALTEDRVQSQSARPFMQQQTQSQTQT